MVVGYKIANKVYRQYVHRLVAEAFLPPDETRYEVNHIDGNKSNNHVSNLEWATHSENHRHAAVHGLSAKAVLKPSQVVNIKQLLGEGFTYKYIADMYNITVSAVNHIKNGRSWNHLTES